MAHRIALTLLACATGASLVAFCGGVPWLAVVAGALYPVSLILLGAVRTGQGRSVAAPVLILAILLGAELALAVFLPEGGPDFLGLPVGTAILIFGVVPLPLFLTSLVYAFTFHRLGLRSEDLDRLRATKDED